MALHAEFRFGVRLFREPDAGNPPVRFDEREEETELRQTGLRRRGESTANRHREASVVAPLLDSTYDLQESERRRAMWSRRYSDSQEEMPKLEGGKKVRRLDF